MAPPRAFPHLPKSESQQAHYLVAKALREGVLVRPDRCSSCGKECRPEGHHEDYSKPLEVVWLCSGCHRLRTPRRKYNPKARPVQGAYLTAKEASEQYGASLSVLNILLRDRTLTRLKRAADKRVYIGVEELERVLKLEREFRPKPVEES